MESLSSSPKVQANGVSGTSQQIAEPTKTHKDMRSSTSVQQGFQQSADAGALARQIKVTPPVPILQQNTRYMLKNGSIVKVTAPGKIERKKLRTKEEYENQVLRSGREQDKEEREAITAERAAALVEREAQQEAARLEQMRLDRLRDREAALAGIPLILTRKDTNFENVKNRHGQGKAHLTASGLEPAGLTAITHEEQLDQGSTNKGTSNLVSFTGPNPIRNGTLYGSADAPVLEVKTKKIARAKLKGKPDAQHIEVYTSSQIQGDSLVRANSQATSYARKDDEHQVRISLPTGGGTAAIPSRFLRGGMYRGAPLVDQHDSDSDDDY